MAAFTRRQYKGAAQPTTITTSLSDSATSINVAATTGWPSTAGVPFYVVIDPGTAKEEKCSATISGTTLTLTRGVDDTTAVAHDSGAVIYPVFTANDADEANELVSKLTTKGDILTTDGTTLNRLGVGANGTFLVANTAATNGVEWSSVNVDALSDVNITSPAEFQTLEYNGTTWVNAYASTVTLVQNAEATTLQVGEVVYLFGAAGDHATVKRADNDLDTTSSKTIGLVGAPIAANGTGPVITRGYVDGIDLSVGYTAGDILYLGESGGFTKVKPSAPEHLVFVGVVVRATNNGIVYVATQNGYELGELHDVKINDGGLQDWQVLRYNSASTMWVNSVLNLDDVANVSASAPSADQFLKWNGSAWVNANIPQINALDDIADVAVAGASSGQFLKWNGTNWVPDTVVSGATVNANAPGTGSTGEIWFESDTNQLYVRYNDAWQFAKTDVTSANMDGGNATSNFGGLLTINGGTA